MYYGNTGSSWLVETLSTSQRVFVPGFEPLERWAWDAGDEEKLDWARTALTLPEDTSSWESIAEWHQSLQRSPQVKPDHVRLGFHTTGWKMAWGAIDDTEGLLEVMASTGARAIVLSRDNRVKHALSLYRYHEEGKSQFDESGIRPPSHVDKASLAEWLEGSRRLHDQATAFGKRCRALLGDDHVFDLSYEQFVTEEGKVETIERLCGFLGLEVELVRRSNFKKATSDDLASALENYAALKRSYRFSRYRRFFTD